MRIIPYLDHSPNHLVTQNYRQTRRGSAPFDLIQLGVTHPTSKNFYQQFPWYWLRNRQVNLFERCQVIIKVGQVGQLQGFHLNLRQGNRLLALIFAFFIGVRYIALFISDEERDTWAMPSLA